MTFVSFSTFMQDADLRSGKVGKSLPSFSIDQSDGCFVHPTLETIQTCKEPQAILVSARGATGKTMSARELSAKMQIPLWSLHHDKAVSGDALPARLTAFLESQDPMESVRAGDLPALIIDSVDEARLRVTGQSWEEFMGSLSAYAKAGLRLVILGRKRTIEDVWVDLEERGVSTALYEISHFNTDQQIEYVDSKALGTASPTPAYSAARSAVLGTLRNTGDPTLGQTFVGYAPVLDAVAALVDRKANHGVIANDFGSNALPGRRITVLRRILGALLQREQGKVAQLAGDLDILPAAAYTSNEQLDWLAHQLLGAPEPGLAWCPASVRAEYSDKLRGFRADHPFISHHGWASPVFASFVAAERFTEAEPERLYDIGNGSGLLFEFLASDGTEDRRIMIESQLAALQASLLAGQWHGIDVEVTVRGASDPPKGVGEVQAHLSLRDSDGSLRFIEAEILLANPSVLELVSPLVSTTVSFPGRLVIQAGHAASLNLGPDVHLRAKVVVLIGSSLQVSRSEKSDGLAPGVEIEAEEFFEASCALLGRAADLTIAVPPEVKLTYPWVNHRIDLQNSQALDVGSRVRRFLDKLMNLARRHGHEGERCVFIKKWQGRQALKPDEFKRALEILVGHGIISLQNEMVFISDAWDDHRYDGKGRPGQPSYEDHRETWDPILAQITAALAL